MKKIGEHHVLVHGESFEQCCEQTLRFFELTQLVKYDKLEILDNDCCQGSDPRFWDMVDDGQNNNHDRVRSLVEELKLTGAASIDDLNSLEHGYPSKVFHVLAHFLDGFIGIDSYFYNLIDDSHWLNDPTRKDITANIQDYWIISIEGYSASPETVGLLMM